MKIVLIVLLASLTGSFGTAAVMRYYYNKALKLMGAELIRRGWDACEEWMLEMGEAELLVLRKTVHRRK